MDEHTHADRPPNARVLVVCTDAGLRAELEAALGGAGYVVATAVSGAAALEALRNRPSIAHIVVDIDRSASIWGLEFLRKTALLRATRRLTAFLLATRVDFGTIAAAMRLAVCDVFEHAAAADALIAALRRREECVAIPQREAEGPVLREQLLLDVERQRSGLGRGDLLEDPTWRLLLELAAALDVGSAPASGRADGVGAARSMPARRLMRLEAEGVIVRQQAGDRRRTTIDVSDTCRKSIALIAERFGERCRAASPTGADAADSASLEAPIDKVAIVTTDHRLAETLSRHDRDAFAILPSFAELLRISAVSGVAAVLLDVSTADETELLDVARHLSRTIPFGFISDRACAEAALAALRMGAADFLWKPVQPEEIDGAVARLLDRNRRASGGEIAPTRAHVAAALRALMQDRARTLPQLPIENPGWYALLELRRLEIDRVDSATKYALAVTAGLKIRTSLRRIDGLISAELVEAFPDPLDSRCTRIKLTGSGREMVDSHLDAVSAMIGAAHDHRS